MDRCSSASSAAPEEASAAVATLLDLPPDVLDLIAGRLPLKDRHRALAPVCRRLDACLYRPALLADLRLTLWREQRCAAFFGWLQRRASGHLRTLHLCLAWKPCITSREHSERQQQFEQQLWAALAACRRLRRLFLHRFGCTVDLDGRLAPLAGSLERLHVRVVPGEALGMPPPVDARLFRQPLVRLRRGLDALTRLVDLEIECARQDLSDADEWASTPLWARPVGSCLPPSLTRLALRHIGSRNSWDGETAVATVQQFSPLPALRELELFKVAFSRRFSLSALPALSSLKMVSCSALPPGLAALPALRSFEFDVDVDDWQRLHAALPSGPWLAGLRSLCVPARFLHSWSEDMWAAARQLEQLELLYGTSGQDNPLPEVVARAARLPALRALRVLGVPDHLLAQVQEEVAAACGGGARFSVLVAASQPGA